MKQVKQRETGDFSRRKKHEIADDLNFITPLLLQGRTLRQMRDALCAERQYTLAINDIRADVQLIMEQWRDERVKMMTTQKALELAKIDRLEATYWDAWEASKKGKVKSISKQSGTIGPAEEKEPGQDEDEKTAGKQARKVHKEKHITETVGDYKWLDGVQWCIDQRCEILGLKVKEQDKPDSLEVIPVRNITFQIGGLKSSNAHIQDAIIVTDDESVTSTKRLTA